MSRFWNSRTREITPYVPGEQPRDRAFIKLNTNECPYPPASAVARTLREMDAETLRLYPDPVSLRLREALSAYYGFPVEQIFVGNGSDEVLALAFQAFFEPAPSGQAISFPDITYSFYPVYAALYGIPCRTVPLEEGFAVPIEALAAPSGGIALANPNAPTGRAVGRADIERLAAADPGRVVIIDEAYVDFGGESALPLLDTYENLLVVMTFSKSRALAGARLGFAIGSRELIEGLERVRDSFNSYPVDRVAELVGIAALSDGAWFEQNRARIIATREKTAERLRAIGLDVIPSSANFLFAGVPGVPARVLYNALREEGILVRYFERPRIDEYLRISIGTPEEMDALCAALERTVPAVGRPGRFEGKGGTVWHGWPNGNA